MPPLATSVTQARGHCLRSFKCRDPRRRPLTYAAGVIRPAPPQDRVVLAHAWPGRGRPCSYWLTCVKARRSLAGSGMVRRCTPWIEA